MSSGIEKATFEALSDFILEVTGARPYPLDDDFVRPLGPYVGCKLLSAERLTTLPHKQAPTENTGYSRYAYHYILRWHIQAYREKSLDAINDILYRMNDPLLTPILYNKGLSVRGSTRISMDSIMKDGVSREKNAFVVVDFHYVYEDNPIGAAPSVIETVGGFPMI